MNKAGVPQSPCNPTFEFPGRASHKRTALAPFIAASVAVALPLVFLLAEPQRAALYALGVAFGVAYQRSRICFVGAVRDPIMFGQTRSARAVLIMIGVGSVGTVLLQTFAAGRVPMGSVYPLGLHTLAGAFLFGLGMVIAGMCACGSVAQSGQGMVLGIVVITGVVIGFRLGMVQLPWTMNSSLPGISFSLAKQLGVVGVMLHFAALGFLYAWLLRIEGSPMR